MRYRSRQHEHPRRAGLTLVEMLIALALSIFIMAILSEAFVKGLEVFGQYKALADLEQRLRTVANIIRRDLRAPHFEGNRKLSECTVSGKPMPILDGLRNVPYGPLEAEALIRQLHQYRFKSPSEGFFSVGEWPNRPGVVPRTTSFLEGQDAFARPSYRDQYDVLHFTSRLEGNEPDKFFYGRVRPGSPLDGAGNFLSRFDSANNNGLYTSQAAELLYFIGPDDTQNLPGVGTPNGPVRTFNLYRQAWLLIPSGFSSAPAPLGDNSYANEALYRLENDVSADFVGTTAFYNTIADVQHRERRIDAGLVRAPRVLPSLQQDGSDILLTNVISFDVKVFDPFAYKVPLGASSGGPGSGRGAYVDIGDVFDNVLDAVGNPANVAPTAAAVSGDALTPVFGATVNTAGVLETFETGTARFDGPPGGGIYLSQSPSHAFPITSIQITIRVYEPKSRQTRQITIIQEM
ncbi:MAG TPA: prepilin-type N-terminal cleavage/methylation domain-containing protein [Gemmatales bacterium]|nr:prepilin-type N-terminal cleavage/methylation domain-containing protein [Gemmatales bacterium]